MSGMTFSLVLVGTCTAVSGLFHLVDIIEGRG